LENKGQGEFGCRAQRRFRLARIGECLQDNCIRAGKRFAVFGIDAAKFLVGKIV
jgi:hypothetical protein